MILAAIEAKYFMDIYSLSKKNRATVVWNIYFCSALISPGFRSSLQFDKGKNWLNFSASATAVFLLARVIL